MTHNPDDLYTRLLVLQGIALAPERADAVARTLAAQQEAERAATHGLPFELEPSAFMRILEGSGR